MFNFTFYWIKNVRLQTKMVPEILAEVDGRIEDGASKDLNIYRNIISNYLNIR